MITQSSHLIQQKHTVLQRLRASIVPPLYTSRDLSHPIRPTFPGRGLRHNQVHSTQDGNWLYVNGIRRVHAVTITSRLKITSHYRSVNVEVQYR
ncbi:hypothetical protein J6590_020866 [Homalodisca vitripennis]|nr:hypothetical protein J6590_020866 [Homalodisca vitripennis]